MTSFLKKICNNFQYSFFIVIFCASCNRLVDKYSIDEKLGDPLFIELKNDKLIIDGVTSLENISIEKVKLMIAEKDADYCVIICNEMNNKCKEFLSTMRKIQYAQQAYYIFASKSENNLLKQKIYFYSGLENGKFLFINLVDDDKYWYDGNIYNIHDLQIELQNRILTCKDIIYAAIYFENENINLNSFKKVLMLCKKLKIEDVISSGELAPPYSKLDNDSWKLKKKELMKKYYTIWDDSPYKGPKPAPGNP